METTTYNRKPLTVEAVQVTEDNLYDVAKWSGGDVHSALGSAKKYIEIAVLHPLHKKQTRASEGDWVLKSDQGFKIYADTAFQKGFEPLVTIATMLPNVASALKDAFDPGHAIPL